MAVPVEQIRTLVIGIGNILLTDDGVGVHVIRALEALEQEDETDHMLTIRDGGTIGLALLSDFTDFGALIVIDAMELGAAPGALRVFQGVDMDAQLGGKKRTAHEVALADLMIAAELTDCAPALRALVAIQPGSTQWGLAPTELVSAAIPKACKTTLSIVERWNNAR
jgi:hydrogenase maturation protease